MVFKSFSLGSCVEMLFLLLPLLHVLAFAVVLVELRFFSGDTQQNSSSGSAGAKRYLTSWPTTWILQLNSWFPNGQVG